MKFSFKHSTDYKWTTTTSLEVLEKAIAKLGIGGQETIEVKRCCEHKKTWNNGGIKTCNQCGEQLEVTTYRD